MAGEGQSSLADWILPGLLALVIGSAPFSIAISQSALTLAILARLIVRPRRPPPRTGLELPLLLWLGWILLTLPAATAPLESLQHMRRWLLLPAVWIFAEAARSCEARKHFFPALALGSGGVAIYGILQGFGVIGIAPEFVEMGKLPLTTNPMTAGALMMICSLAMLAFLMRAGSRSRTVLAAVAFALCLWALAMIQARSCWLGFIAGAFVLLFAERPRWAWLLPALLVLALALGPPRYRDRFTSAFRPGTEYRSNWQRIYMWKSGWRILKDHPFTGIGDRDLRELYERYTPEQDRDKVVIYGHLHSNPVMFAVLWGLPGFVLAMLFLLTIPILQWKRLRMLEVLGGRAPPQSTAWTLAGLAVWTGFFIAGLFEWYFGDAEVILLLWILTGLSLAPIEE